MLRQPQGQNTIQASVNITQTLRSENPSIGVAESIYDGGGHPTRRPTSTSSDTFSVSAPSDIEFHFDEAVINSQAYRRVLARAYAQTRAGTEGESGGPAEESISATLPAALEELQGLDVREPQVRESTHDSTTHEKTQLAIPELEDTQVGKATEAPRLPSRPRTPAKGVDQHSPESVKSVERKLLTFFVRASPTHEDRILHLECFTCAVRFPVACFSGALELC